MLLQIRFSLLIFFTAFTTVTFAADLPKEPEQDCINTTENPSFIVKFKNPSAVIDKEGALNAKFKESLVLTGGYRVSASRPLLNGSQTIAFSRHQEKETQKNIEKIICHPANTIAKWVEEIKKNEEVAEVEVNEALFSAAASSQPLGLSSSTPASISSDQLSFLSPPAANVQGAWDLTSGNSNVIVAVLDDGFFQNDALKPNLLPGISFRNNGEVEDDIFPQHISPVGITKCGMHEHGTHAAGIIASSGIEAYGKRIFGIAPNVKILPVNVSSLVAIGGPYGARYDLLAYSSDVVNALTWLSGRSDGKYAHIRRPPKGIVAVNMSFGHPRFKKFTNIRKETCPKGQQAAINLLLKQNIALSVAAGNHNNPAVNYSPANCEGVITVASTAINGSRASYSNFGSKVKIAAPGGDYNFNNPYESIYSTGNARYCLSDGTSMASPHVAGLIALLYSVDPALDPAQVLKLIQETATPFPVSGDPERNCIGEKSCGAGIINVAAAVQKAKSQAAQLTWNIESTQMSKTGVQNAKITWAAAAWVPERSTPIVYTVNINGTDLKGCDNLQKTECPIGDLRPNATYRIVIKATDIRNIATPKETIPFIFKFY